MILYEYKHLYFIVLMRYKNEHNKHFIHMPYA